MARPSPPALRRVRAAVAAAVADLAGPVGVACSGGPDSVALADAAVAVLGAGRVVLVHVDHGLHPGSGAVADAVRALGAGLGAAVEVARVRVRRGASLEAQARRARYDALDRVAAARGLAAVLAGHTARDQAETVLLRILRGTGPAGLAGIPARRGVHLRPLLAVPRADVLAYVEARRLPVVSDPMNDDARFARVRLRTRLMPALAAENPRLEDALLRLARAAAEWTAVVDARAAEVAALARSTPTGLALAVAPLAAAGPAVGKRALQQLASSLEGPHLDAAWGLATGRSGRAVHAPGCRLERSFGDLCVVTGRSPPIPGLAVRGPDGPYAVRPWRAGDRMRPARLRGRSRKLSDLYAAARVPRDQRATARVVVRADGEIVWAEHVGPAFGAEVAVEPARSERKPFQR